MTAETKAKGYYEVSEYKVFECGRKAMHEAPPKEDEG